MVGTIRSYRIVAPLGSGGMGEVFLAEHTRLRRKVALKLLRPGLALDEAAVERLFSEARAAARLDDSRIVQVYDCDLDENGRPYLAMEYVAGETLADRLARGRLAPDYDVIAELGAQIAAALGSAHAAGVVHCDLKPANVLLPSNAEAGKPRVKIVDFGIARLADETLERGPCRTRAGDIIGTPAYMAPEQCEGGVAADSRADVYALGCVLFEMICGRPPFCRLEVAETLLAHLNDPAPDPAAFEASVPEALRTLVLSMLAKDPAARPQSMSSVAQVLAALPGHRDTLAVGVVGEVALPSGGATAGRRARRGALWLVGAGALGLAIWLAGRAPPGRSDQAQAHPATAVAADAAVAASPDVARAPASTGVPTTRATTRRPRSAGAGAPYRPLGD